MNFWSVCVQRISYAIAFHPDLVFLFKEKWHVNWQWSTVNCLRIYLHKKYFYLRSNIFRSIFKCMTNMICVQMIISPAAAELKNGLQLLGACHCHQQWITIFGDACFINTALVSFLFTFRCCLHFFLVFLSLLTAFSFSFYACAYKCECAKNNAK